MNKPFQYVFGPVPSRRLGRSLGVDLVPFKTCSYDCIYCQLGRTTCKTVQRREWVPLEAVWAELKQKLACQPDYITLSGSGEPTLYSRLEELIARIRAATRTPVAALTNGSLLWQPAVRKELAAANVVIPSLDAGDAAHFQAVNRPHPDITFKKMVSGLEQFRREFTGQYWLEVLLLEGQTASPEQVRKIAQWADRVRPDKVHLNTVVRPPAMACARAVSPARMSRLAKLFTPPAEVIAAHPRSSAIRQSTHCQKAILALLQRRPCSALDISQGLGMKPAEVLKELAGLEAKGRLHRTRRQGQVFCFYAHPDRRRHGRGESCRQPSP